MRNKIILALIILFYGGISFGQNINDSNNYKKASWHNIDYTDFILKDTTKVWQLGINTQFAVSGLFNDSISTPIDVLLKRQVSRYGTIRFRILGITENFKRKEPTTDFLIQTHKYTIGIAAGFERHVMLGQRWKWFYGFELEYRLINDNYEEEKDVYYSALDETGRLRKIIKRKTNRIALLPLLGINFYVTPRFLVSTELKIELVYDKFNYQEDDFRTAPPDKTIFVPTGGSEFSIVNTNLIFKPYTGVYINFNF